jgi:hypothetical protein
MFWRGVVLAILVWISASADAATITVIPNTKDQDQAFFIIEGDLISKDVDEFRTKIASFPKGIVVLQSRGGLVGTGIQIGRIIRLRGFTTWVPSGFICASSCAFIWLGGKPRAMGKNALVGFHAAYHMEDGRPAESSAANAVIGKYFGELGLPDRTVIYLTSAAPTSMQFLSINEAKSLGIEVAVYDLPDQVDKNVESASSLEDRALIFVVSQYERVNGPNTGIIEWARGRYADQVSYFGKARLREDILREMTYYLDRWPLRNYQPRKGSVDLSCNHSRQTCNVKGLLDFEAMSPARREKSTGVATFEFTVSLVGRTPLILSETGRTLQLEKERLVPKSGANAYSIPKNPISLAPR